MLVAVYEGANEVLVFAVDSEGNHIGREEYFDENERPRCFSRDEYDITVGELPLEIRSNIKIGLDRVH